MYDTNGRLKCKKDIRRNGSVTENEDEYNYTYDKFGRMTKCAKTINGKGYTDIYTYNAAGNRTYQSEYIVQENKYRQKQYFWTRGKLLGQYLEGSTITTYKYDYADRLVKRTTGNSTMEYYYDGDRLVAQSSSDGSRIYYFYDDAGVCGAEYNNEYYEFVRNIFGDIVVVLKGGEIAGRYEYDPFGVCTEYTQNNFVKLNPFRYRGYFYDDVSGMYVLKTRYYDPVTAQFLSPDHPDYLDPETIGGIDLYAYCLNNPVMYVDPTGHFPILGFILGLTALAGLATTIAGVATDNHLLTAIGLSAVAIPALISGGMAIVAGIGGATFTGIVGLVTVIAGGGSGLFASAEYQQLFTGSNWMLDYVLSESLYNVLLLSSTVFATLGTSLSLVAYQLKIDVILKIGRISGIRADKGYLGIRFKDVDNAIRSLELHPAHNGHGVHLQLNNWWLNKSGYVGQFYRAFAKHFEFLKFWKGWF